MCAEPWCSSIVHPFCTMWKKSKCFQLHNTVIIQKPWSVPPKNDTHAMINILFICNRSTISNTFDLLQRGAKKDKHCFSIMFRCQCDIECQF